jgi:hypothetical protein
MKLSFQVFRSEGFADLQFEATAKKAAAFASSIGRENVVSISHVLDGHIHVVTVWFWTTA